MASFYSRLLGTWELLSFTAANIDNREDVTYPMGSACKGQIMYSEDGYMAAVLQWGYVEPYKTDWIRATTEEFADAGRRTMAYSGPFYLDEQSRDSQEILHHAKISIPPNWVDTVQLRQAEMTEEHGETILTLGPKFPMEHDGMKRILRLRWRKCPRNDTRKAPAEAGM
ncbi:hypothetical protein A1O1_08899 [Capronia coronata CBS 617.96]|uniref:Lipocalin-like domain-containing protein n=1 Tax=Capronia coronata CBS 617.96 TaxID=1182541 RepID=W9XE81_9EURO|nr:uncharacterized protein A1O1_08899 [Capronia coronata CBS 617.96]EXJ78498.1 hypothetical protein A1O1_08899 [Capronia coronata CBS 617.96]